MSESTNPAISQERVQLAARAMWRLEEILDAALVTHGELTGHILAAQTEGGLSAMCMHSPLIAKLPGLFSALTQARGEAIEVHKGMGLVGKRLDLEVRSDDSPPQKKWDDVVWPWSIGRGDSSSATADAATAARASSADVLSLPLSRRTA